VEKIEGKVIYLWRDPVDVVFSQAWYMDGLINMDTVRQVMGEYKRHLERWLGEEDVWHLVTYEELVDDPWATIGAVVTLVEDFLDVQKLAFCIERVDKQAVKKATAYEDRVMELDPVREAWRVIFRKEHQERIYEYFAPFCSERSSPGA
jgi:hypothetical protein